ncbi:MAG: UDP-N-acetylmuramoyl-tripeptide--D-alanyl-D-alanine ligase [Comamonadaceae bacterium]|jgi:UDP-N-acetylmuramoyl-tripeptide--D-alanyl-D-alanine ligase|nr:UDP-N-acetylmuramoyl-tripeptide--D-alanyl-D-alanine ligase [Comamonadaceae bacterium]
MNLTLTQLQQWLPQAVLVNAAAANSQVQNTLIKAVRTDSRSVVAGDLFIALKGEKFDGTAFLAQAQAQGAVAVLFEASHPEQGEHLQHLNNVTVPAFCVPNARAALGSLAAQWRRQFAPALIGVTGSNGKTTVTQMIASVLRADTAAPSLSTQGNLNNDIGVPLTLFNLRPEHQRAVVELGMNHPGEIEVLAQFAQPTIGLVNNAQREHQEFMSTVEAVAIENGEVIRALPAKGVAVFPAQDAYTQLWQKLADARPVLTFGFKQGDVQAHDIVWRNGAWSFQLWTQQTSLPCRLNIAGRHNILNALAATACALAAGMSLPVIVKGLESFEPVKGRSKSCEWQLDGHAFTLVDDTYNANPDSVRAAIEVLAELPAPRLLVLGDMGEVGLQGAEFHQEVGAYAKACAIQSLFTLGDLCQHSSQAFEGAVHFSDMDSLQARVLSDISAYNSVLVKGSRFMKMERVVEALRNRFEQAQAAERESVHAA